MDDLEKRHPMIILRSSKNTSPQLCNYLIDNHGFTDLVMADRITSFKSKFSLLIELLALSVFVLKNISFIRRANTIFAIGYISIPVRILSKFRIIHYKRLYSYNFFIHSPRWFPLFRWLAKLDIDENRYIINSQSEATLYSETLNINQSRMPFLPFGDWDSRKTPSAASNLNLDADEPYYFSGGYSNRDYVALVKAFKEIPHKLIIVCSWLNSEMNELDIPDNIRVYKDIPPDEFEEYARRAKACILLLKHNSGAAGQLVLLRYMKNRKIIIASAADVIQEYIESGVSGIFIRNIEEELSPVIKELEERPGNFSEFGEAAYKRYEKLFTYEVIASRLSEIISR